MSEEARLFIIDDYVRKLLLRVRKDDTFAELNSSNFAALLQGIIRAICNPTENLSIICHHECHLSVDMTNKLYEIYQTMPENISRDLVEKIHKAFADLVVINPDMLVVDPESSQTVCATEGFVEICSEASTTGGIPEINTAGFIPETSPAGITLPQESRRRPLADHPLKHLKVKTTNKPIKKEYFRSQCIRATKKTLRNLKQSKKPTTGLHQIVTPTHHEIWEHIEDIYQHSITDWESLSIATVDKNNYNDLLCINFFSNDAARRIHYYCCELAYRGEPKDLCHMIKVRCCDNENHSEDCERHWDEVRLYAKFGMLEELGYNRSFLEAEWIRSNNPLI